MDRQVCQVFCFNTQNVRRGDYARAIEISCFPSITRACIRLIDVKPLWTH